MAEEERSALTAPLPIYFQLLGNRRGIRCYGKISLFGQIIPTCIESEREGASAWGFPYHQNLFPQKLHQDKKILFSEHRPLAILILMLLIDKVAAGDKFLAFLHNSSLPKAFNYGKAYYILDQSWEALPHIQLLSPSLLLRALSKHWRYNGKLIAS